MHSFVFYKWTFSMKKNQKNPKLQVSASFLCHLIFFPGIAGPLIFLTFVICWIFCGFCLLSCSNWIPLYRLLDLFPHSLQKPPIPPSDFCLGQPLLKCQDLPTSLGSTHCLLTVPWIPLPILISCPLPHPWTSLKTIPFPPEFSLVTPYYPLV